MSDDSRVQGLEAKIGTLSGLVRGLEATVDGFNREMSKVREDAAELKRMQGIIRPAVNETQRITALGRQHDELRTDLEGVKKAIAELQFKQPERSTTLSPEGLEDRIRGIQSALDEHIDQFHGAEPGDEDQTNDELLLGLLKRAYDALQVCGAPKFTRADAAARARYHSVMADIAETIADYEA